MISGYSKGVHNRQMVIDSQYIFGKKHVLLKLPHRNGKFLLAVNIVLSKHLNEKILLVGQAVL